jgi:hypothetical protein
LVTLTLVVALVVGIGAGTAAPALAKPMGPAVSKHKKVRCHRNQVAIKVKRRTVGCRSLRAALPAPSAGDPRVAVANSALGDNMAGLRDRRGRRAPSLKKLFRKAGPRAYGMVQRAIPRGLALLDQLAATHTTASRFAAAARSAGCRGPSPPTKTDTFTSRSGGQKLTATATLGSVGTLALQLEGGAYRISVRITTDECSHFDAPDCPTATGVLDATDASTFSASLEVAQGDKVLVSRGVDFRGRTRMHAEVGDDARLRLIDIDDTQTANIEVGGSKQQFGPVNLIYTGIHHARVNMPSRMYAPDLSAVDISLTARGVTVGKSDLGQAGNDIAKDLDKAFAKLVDTEIGNLVSRETGWQTPGACATLAFDPPSGGLQPLAKGQSGQLTGHVVAKSDGGTASSGRWTLVGAGNGTISPASAVGASPAFSWTVTAAGNGIELKGDFTATSTAGVASGAWTQPTKGGGDLAQVVGTFTGSRDSETGGDGRWVWSWGGSATFGAASYSDQSPNGSYPLTGGTVTYEGTFTANGPGQFGGCSAHGSATRALNPSKYIGAWSVLGSGDDGLSPPYEYGATVSAGGPESDNDAFYMTVTLSSCPNPGDNGKTDTTALPDPLAAQGTSADGLSFSGTWSGAYPGCGCEPDVWNWDFHGETQ